MQKKPGNVLSIAVACLFSALVLCGVVLLKKHHAVQANPAQRNNDVRLRKQIADALLKCKTSKQADATLRRFRFKDIGEYKSAVGLLVQGVRWPDDMQENADADVYASRAIAANVNFVNGKMTTLDVHLGVGIE